MDWFDDETKFLVGFVALVAAVCIGGINGCRYSNERTMKSDAQIHAVQLECIKGHPPIECKELR